MAKSCHLDVREKILESSTLLWFDPKMEIFADGKKTQEDLRAINDHVLLHTDLNECVENIGRIHKEMIFLITSGQEAANLLPRVSNLDQIHSIFIYCFNVSKWISLKDRFPKIIDAYNDLDELCKSIQAQIALFYRQLQSFSVYDHKQSIARDLSKRSAEFLWYQLFHHLVLALPSDQMAKRQMITVCRKYYQGNPAVLKEIDEFERDYTPENVIEWYTKQCFVSRIVNSALKTESLEQLHYFRFFIRDLSKRLAHEHAKLLSSRETTLICYRGAALTAEQFESLRQSEKKVISMNGYLSTSRDPKEARKFCDYRMNHRCQIKVLFKIESDIKKVGTSVVYGDIQDQSEFRMEQEILFDLNASFILNSIKRENDYYLVNMSVCCEREKIEQNYMATIERQTAENSTNLTLGKILCDLGKYEEAEKHFSDLLAEPNGEDIAWIQFNLGRTFYFQSRLNEAEKYYEQAYDRMMEARPPRVKDSIHVINNLGGVYKRQGHYDKALKYYDKALKLRQQHVPDDQVGFAAVLVNIGDVLDDQEKYDDAMQHYQDALKIQQKAYPSGHIDTAGTLSNIGNIYYRLGQYDKALDYYQQTLEMRQNCYPKGHYQIAASLNNIGMVLRKQKKYSQALETHKHALDMRKEFYKSGHVSIGDSYSNIAVCYEEQNADGKALECYEKALRVYQEFLNEKHSTRKKTEDNIRRLRQKR